MSVESLLYIQCTISAEDLVVRVRVKPAWHLGIEELYNSEPREYFFVDYYTCCSSLFSTSFVPDVQTLNDFDPRELTAEDIVPELVNMLQNLMFEFGFH